MATIAAPLATSAGSTSTPPKPPGSADAAPSPSKITIFRVPLFHANRTPERLAAAVADTVYHENAHHFGISDARLPELQTERPGRG